MVMMLTPSPFPTFQHVSVCLADVRYLCRYITPPTFCLINLTDRSVIQTSIFTTIQQKTANISDKGPTFDVPLILNMDTRWKECNSWAWDSGHSIPGTSASGSRWIRDGWTWELVKAWWQSNNFSDPSGIEIRPPVKLQRVTSNWNTEVVMHNYTVVTIISYKLRIYVYQIRQALTPIYWNNTKTADQISIFMLLHI